MSINSSSVYSVNLPTFSTTVNILLFNLLQLNQVRYDLFYNPTPLNVSMTQKDDIGNTSNFTIPNWAMMFQIFDKVIQDNLQISQNLESLQNQIDEIDIEINQIDGEINNLQNEINQTNANLTSDVNNLQNEINQTNANLTSDANTFQTDITQLQNDINLYMPLKGGVPPNNNMYSIGSATLAYANMYSYLFHGTATSAEYADLAEKYSIKDYETVDYGLAVSVSSNPDYDVELSNPDNREKCIGIISKNPGFMMNSSLNNSVYVALKGRVLAYVKGPIKKSDLLIAGTNGYLYKKFKSDQKTIAISNESIDNTELKIIEVIL
jgi:hypothetical protein